MASKKLLITGGAIAAVAATALLVPGLAFGHSLMPLAPGIVAVDSDRGPGDGEGNAWGHHKDSPDFPGQGRGHDKDSDDFPGQGRGHDKDSDDFPGQGRGHDKDKGED